jgi:hypothetical protein
VLPGLLGAPPELAGRMELQVSGHSKMMNAGNGDLLTTINDESP